MRDRNFGALALTVFMFTCILLAAQPSAGEILNGGFEADPVVLNDWTIFNQPGSSGSWYVQTGSTSPLNGFAVQPPTEGTQAAMTDMGEVGSYILYQDFVVPANADLAFDLYAKTQGAWSVPDPETLDYTVPLNQHIRVDIMDPVAPIQDVGSGVLRNLFLTDAANDPTEFGYTSISTNLLAFAGQLVRLRFAVASNSNFLNVGIDNVAVTENGMCLFCDYFDDGVFPIDWTIMNGSWTESGGNLTNTTPKKNLIVATPIFAGCQSCSVETRFFTSDPKAKLGMLTQRIDKKNGTELLIKMSGKVLLKQRVLGQVVAKGKGAATFLPNTLYKARVAFDGMQYSVFIDDVLLFTLAPGGTVPTGTVGFESKSANSNFSYINVQ